MRLLFTCLGALVAAAISSACGSSSTPASGGPGLDGGGSSSSGGGSGGGSGSGSSSGGGSGSGGGGGSSSGGGSGSSGGRPLDSGGGDGPAPDAGGAQSYAVQFGPITVPPGVENTQCIVVDLGNPAPIHVGQIHDLLGTSSHHMILYKVASQPEQRTPFDCQPFQDTLNPGASGPMVISQKADDTLTLPPNVAFTLDAHQMVRLEMHYINASPSQSTTLVTTSTLTTIPEAAYKYDAAFLFIGDININLPPQAATTLGPIYFQVPSSYDSSNFFAITGHEHSLGTKVQVWSAASTSDPGTLAYTSTSWSDPPTTPYSPPLHVPGGGGFKFQCDWYNSTTHSVSFGESATDEMCFFWAYYWPSQGSHVCFISGGVPSCR